MSKLIMSAGGHVYDHTTGTWQGSTQGSFGDGKNHGYQGDGKVWRDANGITGIQLLGTQGSSDRGGSGPASAQVAANATSANPAGSGPGAASVNQGAKGAGGAGAGTGSAMVTIGVPLKSKMKDENTAFMSGGRPFVPHPGFSNAEEIEELMGDGDSPMEIAWYYKQYAAASHVGWDLGTKIGTSLATFHNSMDNSWVEPNTPLFSPDFNWQQ